MRDKKDEAPAGRGAQDASAGKRGERRTFIKFLILVLLSAAGGALVGIAGVKLIKTGFTPVIPAQAAGILRMAAPWANLVLGAGMLAGILLRIRTYRKIRAAWDGEDEDAAERMDEVLTDVLIATAVGQILGYFFFGLGMYALLPVMDRSGEGALAAILGIIFLTAVCIASQKRAVDLVKEVNPEKRGNVYDMRFHKVWIESCDELERLRIYQASYRAYKATQAACLILWILCFIGMLLFDVGLFPIVVVTAVWMTSCIGYLTGCRKKNDKSRW